MEGFIALASFSLAYAFIVLLGLILLLNILGLPANWVVVLLVVLWKFLHPAAGALDVWFWIMFLGLAVLGEVLEMGVQVMNAKRHGSGTSSGLWWAPGWAAWSWNCCVAVPARRPLMRPSAP